MVICLEQGADLAQLMPQPLTVSCFSKIQIGFTFLVPAYPGSPGKGTLNVCVCVLECVRSAYCIQLLQRGIAVYERFDQRSALSRGISLFLQYLGGTKEIFKVLRVFTDCVYLFIFIKA